MQTEQKEKSMKLFCCTNKIFFIIYVLILEMI